MTTDFDVSSRNLFKRQMVLPLPGNQRWVPQFQRKVIDVLKKWQLVTSVNASAHQFLSSHSTGVGGQQQQLSIGGPRCRDR